MPDVTIKQYEARDGTRAGDPVPDVWDMLSVFILFLLAFDPLFGIPEKRVMDEIVRPKQTAEPVGNAQCCEPEVFYNILQGTHPMCPCGPST